MPKVIWFHFSDLHYNTKDAFNRQAVISALWMDITRQLQAGLLPHFITVTGDLAYSGKDEEYKLVERDFLIPLLERTSVLRNRCYFVPGNHDFDRSYLEYLNVDTIRRLKSRDEVNAFLADDLKREMYLRPFNSYASFVKAFTGATYFCAHPAYAYSDHFEVSGVSLEIVGLNSSWLCNYRRDEQGGDKGYLAVGEHQLRSVEHRIKEGAYPILLMHHPFDWLSEFENATLKRSILARGRLIHHGHVHLASEISHTYASDHDCYLFGAAACYDRREGPDRYANGYSIVTLDTNTGQINLRLRKYVDSPNPHWTSNEDVLGEGSRGELVFTLSSVRYGEIHGGKAGYCGSLDDVYRLVDGVIARIPGMRGRFADPSRGGTKANRVSSGSLKKL